MQLVLVAIVGFLLFHEWRAGRLTLPLRGYDLLVENIARFATAQPIVRSARMTESETASGAIYVHELSSYIASQLDQQRFPRARLHDLRKAACVKLTKRGATVQAGEVKSVFDGLSHWHGSRQRKWTV